MVITIINIAKEIYVLKKAKGMLINNNRKAINVMILFFLKLLLFSNMSGISFFERTYDQRKENATFIKK